MSLALLFVVLSVGSPAYTSTLPATPNDRARKPFELPADWPGKRPALRLFVDAKRRFTTDLDPDSLKPRTTTTLYVDPISGNDENDGASRQRAKRTLFAALRTKGDRTILCRPGLYDLASGWRGGEGPGSLVVEPWDGSGPIVSSTRMTPSWTAADGTYRSDFPESVGAVVDESMPLSFGLGSRYALVKDRAALVPGSYFLEGKTLTLKTRDGAKPGAGLLVLAATPNGRFRQPANLWVRRVVFQGGFVPFTVRGATGQQTTFVDCAFVYSSEGRDGTAFVGEGETTLVRCLAGANHMDGFDYRDGRSFLEIDCVAVDNGWSGFHSDNGSTAHSKCEGIQVMGTYTGNAGRNIHHVFDSRAILLGCTLGKSRGKDDFSADLGAGEGKSDTTALWTFDLRYVGGSNFARVASPAASIRSVGTKPPKPDVERRPGSIRQVGG